MEIFLFLLAGKRKEHCEMISAEAYQKLKSGEICIIFLIWYRVHNNHYSLGEKQPKEQHSNVKKHMHIYTVTPRRNYMPHFHHNTNIFVPLGVEKSSIWQQTSSTFYSSPCLQQRISIFCYAARTYQYRVHTNTPFGVSAINLRY